MADVAVLIIGIGGWDEYTHPLIESIQRFEPLCRIVTIDNESVNAYPRLPGVHRTQRLSYAAAIMEAKRIAGDSDWTVVLSNDVLCSGPFVETLKATPQDRVIGPYIRGNHGWTYVEGWCVCASRLVWDRVGGWDVRFQVSSWEDVDFSVSAVERGFQIEQVPLPFRHLDQQQRFTLVSDYWASESHNINLMVAKHSVAAVGLE